MIFEILNWTTIYKVIRELHQEITCEHKITLNFFQIICGCENLTPPLILIIMSYKITIQIKKTRQRHYKNNIIIMKHDEVKPLTEMPRIS